MNLYTTLLLPGLQGTSHALEEQTGKENNGPGVNDLQPFYPCEFLTAEVVRRKTMAVNRQVMINGFEHSFGTLSVGVRQEASFGHHGNARIFQFAHLCLQGSRYLAQRIKPHYYSIEYPHKVRPTVETFS